MKAKEALKILRITRPTLQRYRQRGYIKAKRLPTGQYDYDRDSIYHFKNNQDERLVVAYARVSTHDQRQELLAQKEALITFAKANNIPLKKVYTEITSGVTFGERKQFLEMLNLILDGKVKHVLVTRYDRLSRVDLNLFKFLFKKFDTQLTTIPDYSKYVDEQEMFSEMANFLNIFSKNMSLQIHK